MSEQVVYEVIDGEAVVLDLVSGRYFQFNEVATRTLELIEKTGDLNAVEDQLAREFEVDRPVLAVDLGTLVGELRARGLLDRANRRV